jgi:nucleotide-binding universal stress UspA family protein
MSTFIGHGERSLKLENRIVVMNLSLILHPLDYSGGVKPALARSLALAKWHEADLHVLHVRSRRRGIDGEEAAHARLREFVDASNPEGVKFETVILAGDPVAAVADYARHKSPELLVVDKHGRRASKLWRAGVFAKELARLVASPTLTVPDNHDGATADALFREILCATDFSPSSIAALKQGLVLAQQSGGRLTVLHVLDGFPYETVYSGSPAFRLIDEHRGLVAQVSGQLRNAIPQEALNWCDVQTRVVSGVPPRAILSTALAIKPDLIVMGLPARSALDIVFMGSTTSPVLRGAQCPVLTVPVPVGTFESQTLMPSSRAPALDSDNYSMVAGRASQANPIGGLVSW